MAHLEEHPAGGELDMCVVAVMNLFAGMKGGDALNVIVNVLADIIAQAPVHERERVTATVDMHVREILYRRGALPRPPMN